MNKDEVISKIKQKGYWIINIHPVTYEEKLLPSRAATKEFVRNAVVELRGWDYPHFRDSDGDPYHIENGIEKIINWENHIEFWRMTQSVNFFHLLALREDWLDSVAYQNIMSKGDELENKKILGVIGTLYTLIEIFEFSKRLIKQGVITSNLVIDIQLHDILNRHLYVDSYNRTPLFFPRVAKTNAPWKWNKEYELSEIVEKVEDFSLEAFLDLLDLFGWDNPPTSTFKDDIKKFLSGRI